MACSWAAVGFAGGSEEQEEVAGLVAGAVSLLGAGGTVAMARKIGAPGFAPAKRNALQDAMIDAKPITGKDIRRPIEEFKASVVDLGDVDIRSAPIGTVVRLPEGAFERPGTLGEGLNLIDDIRYMVRTGPSAGYEVEGLLGGAPFRRAAEARGPRLGPDEVRWGEGVGLDPMHWVPLKRIEPLGVWNVGRKDPENIARGKEHFLSRIDMEHRFGKLINYDEESIAIAKELIEDMPDGLLSNVGISVVQHIGQTNGIATLGQYDGARMIATIATDIHKSKRLGARDLADALTHEVSHHLELFVSEKDILKAVRQYNKELDGPGKRALREAEDAFAYVAQLEMVPALRAESAALAKEISSRVSRKSMTPLSGREIRNKVQARSAVEANRRAYEAILPEVSDELLQEARLARNVAVNRAYKYKNFHEYFAEGIKERLLFVPNRPRPRPNALFDRAVEPIRQMLESIARTLRRLGGFDDVIDDIYKKLLSGGYVSPEIGALPSRSRRRILGEARTPADIGAEPSYYRELPSPLAEPVPRQVFYRDKGIEPYIEELRGLGEGSVAGR